MLSFHSLEQCGENEEIENSIKRQSSWEREKEHTEEKEGNFFFYHPSSKLRQLRKHQKEFALLFEGGIDGAAQQPLQQK